MTTLIPKFDLKDGGSTPTGAVNRPINEKLSETVSVKDFGAVGDGVADDTAAFENAIASLPTGGGTIVIPNGIYAINLVINTSGVCFVGAGTTKMQTAPVSNYLKPFNVANPVIQIGNNSAYVSGVTLENITFYGANTGTTGLALAGGAFRCNFKNIQSQNFTTYCVSLISGSAYAVAYNNFVNVSLSSAVAGVHILHFGDSGTYNVANHFANMDVSGPTASGYALYFSGTQTSADIANTWFQCSNNCGIYFALNTGKIYASNVHIDSDNTTDVLITVASTTLYTPSNFIQGSVTIDGKLSYNGGVTVSTNGYGFWIPDSTSLSYPVVYGDISFTNLANSYSQMDLTTARARVYSSSTNFYLDNTTGGNIIVNSNAGTTFRPNIDNNQYLGGPSQRWISVYAVSGTINTSDANEKTDIVNISETEKRVAIKLKSSMKRFKFKNGDRYHFGTIAQAVKAAFESEGLVAEEYGVFCYDEWKAEEAVIDEKTGDLITPAKEAGSRMGIRYDELFAFIISSI